MRRIAIIFMISVFMCACAAVRNEPIPAPAERVTHAEAAEGKLYAGAAVADITPVGYVWLAGFGPFRRSAGVHDPLEVRAIVLKKGDFKIALVSMDLIGIMKPEIDAYQKALVGFDKNDLVIVGSSHTHSAPDTMGYWGGVKDEYMERVGAAMKVAIETADARAVPAGMLAGSGEIPDGAIKNVRQTDLLDLRVEILRFVSENDNSVIATMVNYACHPETMWSDNHIITADFVHVLREGLQKDGGGTIVYFNGAPGAMVTPDVWRNHKYDEVHTFEEVGRIADIMLRGVRKAIEAAAPVEPTPMRWARIEFTIPIDNPLFVKAAKLGLFDRQIYQPNDVLTQTAAFRLGDVILVTMPGEARPDIGLEVKAATGSPHPFFIGLGNDELGYILPADGFDNPVYTYEPTMSTGKAANAKIVDRALKVTEIIK